MFAFHQADELITTVNSYFVSRWSVPRLKEFTMKNKSNYKYALAVKPWIFQIGRVYYSKQYLIHKITPSDVLNWLFTLSYAISIYDNRKSKYVRERFRSERRSFPSIFEAWSQQVVNETLKLYRGRSGAHRFALFPCRALYREHAIDGKNNKDPGNHSRRNGAFTRRLVFILMENARSRPPTYLHPSAIFINVRSYLNDSLIRYKSCADIIRRRGHVRYTRILNRKLRFDKSVMKKRPWDEAIDNHRIDRN